MRSLSSRNIPANVHVIGRRWAVIPSKNGSFTRRRRRKIRDVSFDNLNLKNIDSKSAKSVEFKVKQLQEFTRNLREHIKVADSSVAKSEAQKELHIFEKEASERDADMVYNELTSRPLVDSQSLMTSSNDDVEHLSTLILASEKNAASTLLPDVIRGRINDDNSVLSFLLDKSQQNWDGIVSKLYKSELRLKSISRNILQKYILSRVDNLSLESIERMDKMLLENIDGDITKFSTSMYECLFFNLAKLKTEDITGEAVIGKMKRLIERFDNAKELNSNAKMTQFILNSCIKYSTKLISFESMNFFLSKFKEDYGLLPNRENYTTIIQFYTRLGVSKQAWNVFDTMKFLSKGHSPDVITYNTVLHLCNKDKNYARAIDIYQEMIDQNIEPSVQTLNIMAKTMARASSDPITSEHKQESLRLLGWKYIHMVEGKFNSKQSDKYLYHTLNSMMALAAYDGDVGLARALYFKYCSQRYREVTKNWINKSLEKKLWSHVLDPELLNYLLLSYSNYNPNKLPLLMGYEEGIKFRRNILNGVDYTSRSNSDDEINFGLPLLPVRELSNASEILFESRAIWQFNLEFGGNLDLKSSPQFLNKEELKRMLVNSASLDQCKFLMLERVAQLKSSLVNHKVLNTMSLTSFLTIPIKVRDKKEFILRLKEFTFQQQEFDTHVKSFFTEVLQLDKPVASNEADQEITVTNEMEQRLAYFASMKHKILANCSIYELMMKAAASFGDLELASKAWRDRGEFRKTMAFKCLDAAERSRRDTEFAFLMVQFFSSQKLFSDALGIIMTSQKYIHWKYPMIKCLHKGLLEIEDMKSIKILLDIVNRKSAVQNIEEQIQELKF